MRRESLSRAGSWTPSAPRRIACRRTGRWPVQLPSGTGQRPVLRKQVAERQLMSPPNPTRREFTAPTTAGVALLAAGRAADAPKHTRVEFTRLVAHWDEYTSPEYLNFIDEVRPQIAQVGFYGGH